MKKPCRITVESTRDLTFPPRDPARLAEELAEALESEDEPFFYGDVPSDRVGEGPCELPRYTPPAPSVLTTDGLFSWEKDGSVRISYEDSPITGLPGCLTTFCLTGAGSVILLRRGEVRTCMIFEKGARHLCDYGAESPVGDITLHTHSLHSRMAEGEGEMKVDYSVEIGGAPVERNQILLRYRITALPRRME